MRIFAACARLNLCRHGPEEFSRYREAGVDFRLEPAYSF